MQQPRHLFKERCFIPGLRQNGRACFADSTDAGFEALHIRPELECFGLSVDLRDEGDVGGDVDSAPWCG